MRPNLESSEDVTELFLNWQSGDDEEAAVHVAALEECDGADNDCDGDTDLSR